jgi:signal transduction histidine kinase
VEKQFGAGAFGWVTSLTDRLAPVGLGLLVLLFTLVSPNDNPIIGMTTPFDGGGPDYVVLWGIAVLGAVAAVVARRWRWPLFTMALVGWLFFTAVPIVVVSAYYAAVWLTRRQTLLFLGVAVPLVAVPPIIGHAGYDSVEIGVAVAVLSTGLMIGLPYAIGLWVNVRRQVVAGLQAEAKRLAREHAAAADQARAQERTRIAREMHDVLAHRVALMVLHAGALEVNAVDERSATEAALIRTTGREALTELRQVLGVLRAQDAEPSAAPQPDLSDVERLLGQARTAGLTATLRREGDERPLPLVVQRTAYRVIQEALTNVAKHTGGAQTAVLLRYLPSTVEVVVENGPPVPGVEPMPGSGLGMVGLRERVALLDGRLEAGPRLDGGYRVLVALPAAPTDPRAQT